MIQPIRVRITRISFEAMALLAPAMRHFQRFLPREAACKRRCPWSSTFMKRVREYNGRSNGVKAFFSKMPRKFGRGSRSQTSNHGVQEDPGREGTAVTAAGSFFLPPHVFRGLQMNWGQTSRERDSSFFRKIHDGRPAQADQN